MKLLLATHESSMCHDTGYGHPERPSRVPAVLRGIESTGIVIENLAPEPATPELLGLVHDGPFVEQLERFCAAGGGAIDIDTIVGPGSWEAALRAAAAGPAVCQRLLADSADLAYVVMRPPGHHAVRDRAMGFCLFNNIAITARYLTQRGDRVAIVDWDAHHGNGTQELFYDDPAVLYMSIHQQGIYPGTGFMGEVGVGEAVGTNLNMPVPGRTGGGFHRRAVADLMVPIISQFEPQWLLVSSGYDSHAADPLASLRLLSGDYGAMAKALAPLVPAGRAVIFLEGGYDLRALEESAAATVNGWLDPEYELDPHTEGSNSDDHLVDASGVAARYWKLA